MRRGYPDILDHPVFLGSIIFLLAIAAGIILNHMRITKQNDYFSEQEHHITTSYEASLKMYELAMESFFANTMQRDDIMSLFVEGARQGGYARALSKGRLYRQLFKAYQVMEKHNLLQLNFHLADGSSYLRFHKPEKYGDNLLDARESVALANRTRSPVSGFEIGKVQVGFRHVFPLSWDNEHIGTVEVSVSTKAISESMANLDPDTEYLFLLNRHLIEPHVFEEQKWIYSPSFLHPDFVIEDALSLLANSPAPVSEHAEALNRALSGDRKVAAALDGGKNITIALKTDGVPYVVSFLPLYDVRKNLAGFIGAYKQDDTPNLFLREQTAYIAATMTALAIITFLLLGLRGRTTALKKERGSLQTINNTVAEGLISIDPYGTIRHLNPAACKIIGVEPEQMIGRKIEDEINLQRVDSTSEERLKEFLDTIMNGRPYDGELCYPTVDGRNPIVKISSRPMPGENTPGGAVIAFHDISKRKETEEALLTSEEKGRKFSAAVDQSSMSIVITDLEGTIEYVNPMFTMKTGYSSEEAVGANSRILKSGKMSPSIYQDLWTTLKKGGPWTGELQNKRKNGELYWEFVSISPIRDNNGIPTHYIAVKEDITERREMEEELREREFIQRTLMVNLPVGLIIIDEKSRKIEHVNPAAAELFGAPTEKIIGSPCNKFLCAAEEHRCPILDLGQEMDNSERQLLDSQNNPLTVIKTVTKLAIKGENKLLECFVDISKRIEAETKLRLSNEQLQEAHDRVEKLARQADAANRAKSMFLANMSHEIRTPLNAILGYSQLLSKDDSLEKEQLKKVLSINRCGDHLLDLLNNILETSKIEAGQITLTKEKVDLDALLVYLESMFKPACISKGIGLTFNRESVVIKHLMADKKKIRQVLMNLIDNSIKFTEHGAVTVKCSSGMIEHSDEAGVCIDITDTGAGVKQEEQDNLFRPFEQTSSGHKAQKGTGLGLSICRAFGRVMGGDVQLTESIPGERTTFRFTFTAEPLSLEKPSDVPDKAEREITASLGQPEDYEGVVTREIRVQEIRAMAAGLPKELGEALRASVEEGNMAELFQLISEKPELHTTLGEQLKEWGQQFEYDKLIAVLSRQTLDIDSTEH